MDIEVLTDEPYLFSGLYERTKFAAPGLYGAGSGAIGRVLSNNGTELRPKLSRLLPANTVIRLELPGGGGYGSPLDRDPFMVLRDVHEGYVSAEAARSEYGVIIDQENWSVDEVKTAALRAELRAHLSNGSSTPQRDS